MERQFPKNVRQIGNVSDEPKSYMEDYVDTVSYTHLKAVRYLARMADGSMRDSLSLLDQCAAFYIGEKLTYDHVLEVLGAVAVSYTHLDVYKRQICM